MPDVPTVGTRISQKQYRHIEGRPEWVARGRGGHLSTLAEAQSILDAFHAGTAEILGTTSQGHIVVKHVAVTGFHNAPGTGHVNQPTNVFMIKGSSSPSVVLISPTWRQEK